MADGGSAVKQFAEETTEVAKEVVKDVKDSVGQALEQGVQSVIGTQLTPQQIQQKQLEDQKKIAEKRREIKWYQDIAVAQKKVRDEEKQKQMQRKQAEVQEQQTKQAKEIQQKQSIPQPGQPLKETLTEEIARTQVERSKGRGIGG